MDGTRRSSTCRLPTTKGSTPPSSRPWGRHLAAVPFGPSAGGRHRGKPCSADHADVPNRNLSTGMGQLQNSFSTHRPVVTEPAARPHKMPDMTSCQLCSHRCTELAQLRSEVERLTASLAELRQRDAHLQRRRRTWSPTSGTSCRTASRGCEVQRAWCRPRGTLVTSSRSSRGYWEEDQQTFRNDIAAALASD